MFAAESGSSEIVQLLLQQSGVDVNAARSDGMTALFFAVDRKSVV